MSDSTDKTLPEEPQSDSDISSEDYTQGMIYSFMSNFPFL